MALTAKRKKEIMRLVYQGGDDLTDEILDDAKQYEKYRRQIRREMLNFVSSSKSKDEIHFFAQNWNWDGDIKPIFALIKNPICDAGTLLFLYWYGCPEYYYLFNNSAREINDSFSRDVFRLLRQIETRFTKKKYRSATIPFDPTPRISMWNRRDEFARQIPEVMYKPLPAKRK